MMQPDLELVHIRKGESFAAWRHGYPFRTVRWHYHPEYEIHLVVATSGTFYIGDFVGRFGPGQLIMTGPNLPQNWISEIEPDEIVPTRSLVIQFPEAFIEDACTSMSEMEVVRALLDRSRRGILFDDETSDRVRPLILRLIEAQGLTRLALFWEILDLLVNAPSSEVLASLSYELDLTGIGDSGINRALSHLRQHLTEQVEEIDLAEMVGQSQSAFSRAFKRHTGTTLVRYRNQLRIDLACQMLLADQEVKVAEVCYDVGFSNLSNFNRHFLKLKGMSPSRFRTIFAAQKAAVMAD
ncbi:AraC family transcriptional regulator [Agrobacterium sp. TS43]|jgi:AraC-like DNA-binding protein|nr:AraC family transcriptional regulator [Agrobacterium radiobacter DSM 30147]KVK50884.1 AraC family transcriptional regulator [Agrobacterium sp. JL28]KVK51090.1 AraC family transcriptional regulator [Agrobacterium sp. LY4]KVK55618.1 AraC family transcriptional regulator [Agrobacterium sp. TS43]KVK63329.1 AraC family transcriptional regulator [Agrobacterium sp. TS45]KVK67815.1 AraC family transcriptional regulator [Agrobacterium sp. C13]